MLKRVWSVECGKQREATAPIQYLLKLQSWVRSLQLKTCLRQTCSLGSCACSEGPALGQNTLMMIVNVTSMRRSVVRSRIIRCQNVQCLTTMHVYTTQELFLIKCIKLINRQISRPFSTELKKNFFVPFLLMTALYYGASKAGALLILQPFRLSSPTSQLILQPFRRLTYITAHSPTLLLLHLRHSTFSTPSFASLTSQVLHLIHLASCP